jgi:hypothetical protein
MGFKQLLKNGDQLNLFRLEPTKINRFYILSCHVTL